MSLKIYRIDRSLLGKMGRFLKKPDLPVLAMGTCVAGGLLTHLYKTAHDVMADNFYILHDAEEIARFHNPTGESLCDQVYYIRNPREAYTRELIPAAKFHHYIIRQQATEMIDFVRSNLKATRIEFELFRCETGKVNLASILATVGGPLPVSGCIKVNASVARHVVIECDHPLKPSEKRTEYGWIKEFPQLLAAVDSASGSGNLTISEEFDYSFDLKAKAAELMEVSASWLGKHHWKLQVVMA